MKDYKHGNMSEYDKKFMQPLENPQAPTVMSGKKKKKKSRHMPTVMGY